MFCNKTKCLVKPICRLKLKVCVPIVIIRNIHQSKYICNDLQVNEFDKYVISVIVITGQNGSKYIYTRMN